MNTNVYIDNVYHKHFTIFVSMFYRTYNLLPLVRVCTVVDKRRLKEVDFIERRSLHWKKVTSLKEVSCRFIVKRSHTSCVRDLVEYFKIHHILIIICLFVMRCSPGLLYNCYCLMQRLDVNVDGIEKRYFASASLIQATKFILRIDR